MTLASIMSAIRALFVSVLVTAATGCYIVRPVGDAGLARSTRMQMGFYMVALEQYKADAGDYPSTEEGLQALRVKPPGKSGWKGPYLQHDVEKDGWGRPYIYLFPGKHGDKPDIISYGKDGRPGGSGLDQDITSWSLRELEP